jgi:hypothetical protein
MATTNQSSIRFSPLTVLVWLLVAAGVIYLLWSVILRMSSQKLPLSTSTPGLTQVYETIAAMLSVQGTPSAPASTHTGTPSPTILLTLAPTTAQPISIKTAISGDPTRTETPAIPCNRAAAGNPIDISIPDDSELSPGQSFIKTWKLVNTGSCTWTSAYSASFFYGDRMGAPGTVPFEHITLPANEIEISVEMVAPRSPGTYQGNWILSNAKGDLFGIGPNADAPFWVRIVVVEDETPAPSPTQVMTATLTPTGTITSTVTPPGDVGASLLLASGDTLDLDTLTLNANGPDLSYLVGEGGEHWLTPIDSAALGEYGIQQPELIDCQSANQGSAPIAVESLSIGTYLCYTTTEGRLGRALLTAVDPDSFTITLDLLTWALP